MNLSDKDRRSFEPQLTICNLCGRDADALWFDADADGAARQRAKVGGYQLHVSVCRQCAIDTLPQLIGDAIATTDHLNIKDCIERIESGLYRSLAIALSSLRDGHN